MFRKNLPATLTSYDILKTVAVVLMVVDHIGAYYMPENLWLRLIGRMCVPMWFFLIGYARSRDISRPLWLGAAIVIASDFITGRYIFPLNILVTILMVRIVIDLYIKGTMKNTLLFWTGALVLTCLIVPSMTLMQYGTLGLLLAVFGWLIRNTEEQDPHQFTRIFPYMVFCIIAFTISQWALLQFSLAQGLLLFGGTALVMLGLRFFRPAEFPGIPAPVKLPLQLIGRYTLAIYVAHLLLIKIAGLWLYPEYFSFGAWDWFPPPLWERY